MIGNKQDRLVVTFGSTAAALQMEKCCRMEAVAGRLIPVPREITAGCGLAWCAPPEEESRLHAVAATHDILVQGYHWILI